MRFAAAVMLILLFSAPIAAFDESTDCPPGDPCITYLHLRDDVSPNAIQTFFDIGWQIFLDGKDPQDPTSTNPSVDTPSITRLAASGVSVLGSAVMPVCTPTRNGIIYQLEVDHYANRVSHVVLPGDEPGVWHTNPGIDNWIKQMEDAGFLTFFAGKWHGAPNRFHDPSTHELVVKTAGFSSGAAIRLGNDTNQWNPIGKTYVDYSEEATGYDWATCGGTNFSPMIDFDGNVEFSSRHAGAAAHDEADAYMAAQVAGGGAHLVVVWCSGNHNPLKTGEGEAAVCPEDGGGLDTPNDYPPGDSFTAGDLEHDVWLKNLAYDDGRVGETLDKSYFDITATGNDIYCDLTDNGTQVSVSNVVSASECDDFSKQTGQPCGVDAGLICAGIGRGISQGVMPADQMMSHVDIGPTLLAAHGLVSRFPRTSRSLWDCMTESNGETHEACSVSRDHIDHYRFRPVGTVSRTDSRFPDPQTDPAQIYSSQEHGARFWHQGVRYFLYREYDEADQATFWNPYRCWERLYQYSSNPADATRYGNGPTSLLAANGGIVSPPLEANCAIDLFDSGDWATTPTADQLAAIAIGRARIAEQGTPLPSSY